MSLRNEINSALKEAMKEKAQLRVETQKILKGVVVVVERFKKFEKFDAESGRQLKLLQGLNGDIVAAAQANFSSVEGQVELIQGNLAKRQAYPAGMA